jgi:hypothetical protein
VTETRFRPGLDVKVRVPRHVVYRNFAAETVVMNLETGGYHGLSPAAGRVLELVDRAGTVRLAAARFASDEDTPLDQAERHCEALCASFVDLGLLEPGEPGS